MKKKKKKKFVIFNKHSKCVKQNYDWRKVFFDNVVAVVVEVAGEVLYLTFKKRGGSGWRKLHFKGAF